MTKKMLSGITIAGLSIIFVIVSIMVLITKGNPKLIKHKLKIGAMLITIIGAINTFSPSCTQCYIETCYDSIQVTSIIINEASNKIITLDDSTVISLTGEIRFSNYTNYSFKIFNSSDIAVISQNISAHDGAFDESTEEISINTGTTLSAGEYKLKFYNKNLADITDGNNFIEQFTININ